MSAGVSEHYDININSTDSAADGVQINDQQCVSRSSSSDDHPITTAEANVTEMFEGSYKASLPQIVFLGLGIILGGTVIGWSKGLQDGFWTYFYAFVLVSLGYLVLALCIAELTSIMAFSGGAFGYIRCSLSPFLGYLMGSCELLQNNMLVVASVFAMGKAFTELIGLQRGIEFFYFVLLYVAILAFHIPGGRYFWTVMTVCAFLSLFILVLYCFGSMFTYNGFFKTDITSGENYRIGLGQNGDLLQQMYFPTYFFIGTETLINAGAKISNGTQVIPRALLICYGVVAVVATWMLFTTVTLCHDADWDRLIKARFPISFALKHSLDVPYAVSSILVIIPNYAKALGFMYASKHLLHSMACSGLFPVYFKKLSTKGKVPLRALFTCAFLQFGMLIVGWIKAPRPIFYELCILGAATSYIGIFIAFIVFRRKYPGMQRSFRSPLGVWGAYFGIFIFLLVMLSVIILRPSAAFQVYLLYAIFMVIYYFCSVQGRQGFSDEEQKRFMRAYILNSNNQKKRKNSRRFGTSRWARFWRPLNNMGHYIWYGQYPSERVHIATGPESRTGSTDCSDLNSAVNRNNILNKPSHNRITVALPPDGKPLGQGISSAELRTTPSRRFISHFYFTGSSYARQRSDHVFFRSFSASNETQVPSGCVTGSVSHSGSTNNSVQLSLRQAMIPPSPSALLGAGIPRFGTEEDNSVSSPQSQESQPASRVVHYHHHHNHHPFPHHDASSQELPFSIFEISRFESSMSLDDAPSGISSPHTHH